MSFLKKVTKLAKSGLKAYASYQTGGLSGLATSALSKKGKMPRPMLSNAISQSTGLNVIPAAYLSGGMETIMQLPRITRGGMAIKRMMTAATLGAAAEGGAQMVRKRGGASGTFTAPGMRKKHRRINPGNIKALRRSVRRIHSAEKMFRQVLSVQGKHHAGIKPKKGRGKR